MEWLRRCFEPTTRDKSNGLTRLLICDGHESHVTGAFVAHCMQNNIILMVLPPHSSHYTQPLDLALFSPLKTVMSAELSRVICIGIVGISEDSETTYNRFTDNSDSLTDAINCRLSVNQQLLIVASKYCLSANIVLKIAIVLAKHK